MKCGDAWSFSSKLKFRHEQCVFDSSGLFRSILTGKIQLAVCKIRVSVQSEHRHLWWVNLGWLPLSRSIIPPPQWDTKQDEKLVCADKGS